MNKVLKHPAWTPLVASLVLVLSGCASSDIRRAPELTVPANWQQASQAAAGTGELGQRVSDRSAWWLALNDPVLNQLVEQAQARNVNLAQAAVKVRRAQLVAGQAASDQLPSVAVQGNVSRARQLDGGTTTQLNSVTGSVSWEVDLWGRLSSLRNAADWEAQATEFDRQAASLSLSATVANLYWQIAYLNQRVAASEQSMDYARRTLTLVQAQYGAGDAAGLELAQATQALATQQASHTQWLQQRVQARNALAILLDAPPGTANDESLRLHDGALPSVNPGLPASVLNQRPDLQAAQLRLRKTLANVDAIRDSFYPRLTLTGSVGGTSTELSQVLRDPVGTLGAGLLLPFVQWRDMQRSVAISEADYEVAVLGLRQTWYQALADVENALSARQQYEDQGQQLATAWQAAQTAERLSEARYRAGAVPLKTWLDAQEARRQAENNLAQNRLSRLSALATLHQVLGG